MWGQPHRLRSGGSSSGVCRRTRTSDTPRRGISHASSGAFETTFRRLDKDPGQRASNSRGWRQALEAPASSSDWQCSARSPPGCSQADGP